MTILIKKRFISQEVTREDTAFASEKADAEEDIRRYMKENAKMIAEESLELPIRIKGIEAPPLTPEQLKLIPTLMEVVHVGHNADVKTEQVRDRSVGQCTLCCLITHLSDRFGCQNEVTYFVVLLKNP